MNLLAPVRILRSSSMFPAPRASHIRAVSGRGALGVAVLHLISASLVSIGAGAELAADEPRESPVSPEKAGAAPSTRSVDEREGESRRPRRAAADSGGERPGAAFAEIFGERDEPEQGSPSSGETSIQGILRGAALAGGLALVLFGALVLLRRLRARSGGAPAAEWVQVIGRVSLTPRHSVHVIRCGQRAIVVGVAGEHMTPLADLGACPEALSRDRIDRAAGSLDGLLGGEGNALPAAQSPEVATREGFTPRVGGLGRSRFVGIGPGILDAGVDPLVASDGERAPSAVPIASAYEGWAFGSSREAFD